MRIEQRRGLRIPVDLPARYRSGSLSLDGRARDLSQGGLFFAVPRPEPDDECEPVGDICLELDLPDDDAMRPLVLAGEVRWIEGSGMGIRFTQLPIADRRRLANFLIHRAYAPVAGLG